MFVSRTGTRLLDRNVRRDLDQAAKRAGVEWATLHTLRHTCASMLFDGGKNIRQVAAWLGHADPAFTLRTYIHLQDDGLGDADILDAVDTTPGGEHPEVGNRWATEHPETTANETPATAA